jgi:hypothetical protein
MPFTEEAQAKIAAIYGWFRQRLVLLVIGIMLFLQFMTWRAVDRLYIFQTRQLAVISHLASCEEPSDWKTTRFGAFPSEAFNIPASGAADERTI